VALINCRIHRSRSRLSSGHFRPEKETCGSGRSPDSHGRPGLIFDVDGVAPGLTVGEDDSGLTGRELCARHLRPDVRPVVTKSQVAVPVWSATLSVEQPPRRLCRCGRNRNAPAATTPPIIAVRTTARTFLVIGGLPPPVCPESWASASFRTVRGRDRFGLSRIMVDALIRLLYRARFPGSARASR
jgi:hypothetical protein